MNSLSYTNKEGHSYQYRSEEKSEAKKIYCAKPRAPKQFTVGIIIDTDLRLPPKTGVTYRLYYLSRELQKIGVGVKIFLCNRRAESEIKKEFCDDKSGLEYHFIPEDKFYNPTALCEILKKQNLDIVQFEDSVSALRYLDVIRDLELPICLELHDVEASLIKGLGFKEQDVNFAKAVTALACQAADAVVCMTETDKSELTELVGIDTSKLFMVPNPIDGGIFRYYGPNVDNNLLIFIGNMFYWPNAEGAKILCQKIFPFLKKQIPSTRCRIVGMVPEELRRELEKADIEFTGVVDHLGPHLKEATLAFCPVYVGSGMKVKILNYCAAGMPVITTPLGQSGYEKLDALIVEESPEEMSRAALKLLEHTDQLKERGKLLKHQVIKHFGIVKIAEEMRDVYTYCLARRSTIHVKHFDRTLDIPKPLWLQEGRAPSSKGAKYFYVSSKKNNKSF